MKVLIIGATGQLGSQVTKRALDAGHEVTAFARNPNGLLTHPALRLHPGDVNNIEQVKAAVKNQDAVIITIGTGKSRKNTVRSDGTRNVITAMEHHGVKRLICQTTLGCQETWESLNFYWKRIMFGAVIRPVFKDHEEQERLTQASDLEWTIVRPSAFKEVADEGELLVNFPPSQRGLKCTVAKTEVASFMIDQLPDRAHLHKAVSLSR